MTQQYVKVPNPRPITQNVTARVMNVDKVEQELCEIVYENAEYESAVLMRTTSVKVKGKSLDECHEYGKKVLKNWKPRKRSNNKVKALEYLG